MRDGFSIQAGAGGINLAFLVYLKERMKKTGVRARFIRGGSTKYLVEMLEEGLTDFILDGQAFDQEGIRSLASNQRHVSTSPFTSYNYHGKGNFASMLDAVVLGARSLWCRANVVTLRRPAAAGSADGRTASSRTARLAVPSFRDRVRHRRRGHDTCGLRRRRRRDRARHRHQSPPRRPAEAWRRRASHPALRDIQRSPCALQPARKRLDRDSIIAVVKWVDGTLLDSVFGSGNQQPRDLTRSSSLNPSMDAGTKRLAGKRSGISILSSCPSSSSRAPASP
jgi:citrate lyase subunit alpha/citrate CoA-transferase